jgi:hypothetical protein
MDLTGGSVAGSGTSHMGSIHLVGMGKPASAKPSGLQICSGFVLMAPDIIFQGRRHAGHPIHSR